MVTHVPYPHENAGEAPLHPFPPALFTIKNPEGVELGTLGFAKAVNKHAQKNSEAFATLVVNILDNYAGKEIDETDITFITVKRKDA